MRFAVLRERIPDLQPRRAQQVPKRVLVLVSVEPSARGAPLGGYPRGFGPGDASGECLEKLVANSLPGMPSGVRWHLTGLHPVVHLHPRGKDRGIAEVEIERLEIQIALPRGGVVAVEA